MQTTTPMSERVSVLGSLRTLLPNRRLHLTEALRLAELQANRLLTLQDALNDTPVSHEVITRLPGIAVDYDIDMPASGASVWDAHHRQWVITLRASEPDTRHRFTLLHEYKHIVDHGHAGLIAGRSATCAPAETVADYFAACVLMPRRLIKSAFFRETQSIAELAERFDVSRAAMQIRLQQLGLAQSFDVTTSNTRQHMPRARARHELSSKGYPR